MRPTGYIGCQLQWVFPQAQRAQASQLSECCAAFGGQGDGIGAEAQFAQCRPAVQGLEMLGMQGQGVKVELQRLQVLQLRQSLQRCNRKIFSGIGQVQAL
ncbi:hypothetical protein D3C80_1997960 [compost metagenome]